jgi:signal transduction histidine kinase
MALYINEPSQLKRTPMGAPNDVAVLVANTPVQEWIHTHEHLAERTRIAQELHDTLLQGFFAVSMQLQAAVDQLPPDSAARPRFSDLLPVIHRVLEEGRSALQGLRSRHAQSTALEQALASVPAELGLSPAVGFRVVAFGRQRDLSSAVRHEVYRIGREAIVNAFRHARATRIEIEVHYRPSELQIIVRDNGCGIDDERLQWDQNTHWGLRGMRERAEVIGARLRILSRVSLGTEVDLSIAGATAYGLTTPRYRE